MWRAPSDSRRGSIGAQTLRYRVEGMDCASCAAKIENALARIDGVTDVQVNYAAERLTLRLVETGADVVEEDPVYRLRPGRRVICGPAGRMGEASDLLRNRGLEAPEP